MSCIRLQVESVETHSGKGREEERAANPLSEFVVNDAPQRSLATFCNCQQLFLAYFQYLLLLFIIVALQRDRWHCTSLSFKIFLHAKVASEWSESSESLKLNGLAASFRGFDAPLVSCFCCCLLFVLFCSSAAPLFLSSSALANVDLDYCQSTVDF